MNKKLLLILLVSAPMYGNTIVKESLIRRLICKVLPCIRKQDKLECYERLIKVPTQTTSDMRRYKNGLNMYGATPITSDISRRCFEAYKLLIVNEKKDRNKLYVPVDSRD